LNDHLHGSGLSLALTQLRTKSQSTTFVSRQPNGLEWILSRNTKLNPSPIRKRTAKYLARHRAALQAASSLLNRKGLKGMTRGEVAEHMGVVEGALSYYFASKEALAAACFHLAIEARESLISEAAEEATPIARVSRLVRGHFERARLVACGEAEEVAVFDDLRALGHPGIDAGYVTMFRNARKLLESDGPAQEDRQILNARTHWLLQQLIWVDIWLPRYEPDSYARTAERMIDILTKGLAPSGRAWRPPGLVVPEVADGDFNSPRETFLVAATQLINLQGYRGASVEKIAARLGLTKGAFYHHIDAKDDLVAVCFTRSAEMIRRTQLAAERLKADAGDRLSAALISLVEHQLKGDVPLLRAQTVSLPDPIRNAVLQDFERSAVAFGSTCSDGIADGSIRPVDIQIAAQMITATVNAAAELNQWIPASDTALTARTFVRLLFEGLSD
jgi:AcrR family transcriptional regulator